MLVDLFASTVRSWQRWVSAPLNLLRSLSSTGSTQETAFVQAAFENGERTFYAHHITRDVSALPLRIQVAEQEEGIFVLGRCARIPAQLEPFEGNSAEATVLSTLDAIARIIEEQNPGFKCSILLVADGRFVSGAGPSLPKDYNSAIDGYAIGSNVGSCGTAIFWNVPVIVEDIQADPLWAPLAELAKKAGTGAGGATGTGSKDGGNRCARRWYCARFK